jgi:predicted kinase
MKELFLLRGLPGSGKTTLAKSIGPIIVEADHYFIDEDGEYKFDATQLKNAHNYCQIQTQAWMTSRTHQINTDRIVVSNTFTQEWEMEIYFRLAEKYGYRVYSLICENRHGGINSHGVPDETLEKMKTRFDLKLI